MMISLKYALALCPFCSKFLETSCKNVYACTTVATIHTDPTVNHGLICTSGSYTSQHTQCMQLYNSQVNFDRKGGPRANADLLNLLSRVIFHHLWCKLLPCCFRGLGGALATSATDIQKPQVNKCCSQQVQMRQAASVMHQGPWDLPANTNCVKVRPPQYSQFCFSILIKLLPFQQECSPPTCIFTQLLTLCGFDEAKPNRKK